MGQKSKYKDGTHPGQAWDLWLAECKNLTSFLDYNQIWLTLNKEVIARKFQENSLKYLRSR